MKLRFVNLNFYYTSMESEIKDILFKYEKTVKL